MGCAWRRARYKRDYGKCLGNIFATSVLARDQLNPYLQSGQGKEVELWQSGADHNVRLHKGTVHRVMKMLDLDATPQEGMIFHFAGQAYRGWRVFDIWDLPGAFDQFPTSGSAPSLRIHIFVAAEELNKLSDPESVARKLAFALPEQRDQLAE